MHPLMKTRGGVPGVQIEMIRARDTTVRGVPLGIPGFLGYAAPKPGTMPSSGVNPWPVVLESVEQIDAKLDLPGWGHLGSSLRSFFRNGGTRCLVAGIALDAVHHALALAGEGAAGGRGGLRAIDISGQVEIIVAPDLFLIPPGCDAPGLEVILGAHGALLDFCAGRGAAPSRGGYFALLDAPPGLTGAQVVRYARRLRQHRAAAFGALHFPWVSVIENDGTSRQRPPSGAAAGLTAMLSEPPPGSPTGTVTFHSGPHHTAANRSLVDVVAVERPLRRTQCGELLEVGINCLVPWPGRGVVLWGARTLSTDPEQDHITVRRILSYIQRSIHEGTQWAVFEPNSSILWLQLTSQIDLFLEELWSAGVLVGASKQDSFYVKCDAEVNPPAELEQGRVHVDVWVRPVRSTEFIMLRILHEGTVTSGA